MTANALTTGNPLSHTGHWYVVQCRANQNGRAVDNLANQGFHCYNPQLQVEQLRAGKRTSKREALFPGYVFVRLGDQTQGRHKIRSTRGVQKLVAFGGYPAPISGGVIAALQQAENTHAEQPAIRQGDKLRISDGPFANLEATFVRFDGQERVIVLLNILQQQQQLQLSVSSVTKH